MNKIYKTVWNETTGTWMAVQETAKGKGKSSGSTTTPARSSLLALVPTGSFSAFILGLSAIGGFTLLPATSAVAAV